MTRKPPPPLDYVPPLCPLCGEDTRLEDECWECRRCEASWSYYGNDRGDWDDPAAEQCRFYCEPWKDCEREPKHLPKRFQCELADGHEGAHRNEIAYADDEWTSDQEVLDVG